MRYRLDELLEIISQMQAQPIVRVETPSPFEAQRLRKALYRQGASEHGSVRCVGSIVELQRFPSFKTLAAVPPKESSL